MLGLRFGDGFAVGAEAVWGRGVEREAWAEWEGALGGRLEVGVEVVRSGMVPGPSRVKVGEGSGEVYVVGFGGVSEGGGRVLGFSVGGGRGRGVSWGRGWRMMLPF